MTGKQREGSREYSTKIALCGIMAGLSVALLLGGGLIPVATYCTPLLAGLLLIPVRTEYPGRWGLMVWLTTALCALLFSTDREAAFLYGFLGYYPLLKPKLDRLKNRAVRLLAKVSLIAAAISAMYVFLCLVIRLDTVVDAFASTGKLLNAAFFLTLIVCILLYDRALEPATVLYCRRIRPKLKFLR